MLKTLVGYVPREQLESFREGTSDLKVLSGGVLRFHAFEMQLASGELIPIQITFSEKETKIEAEALLKESMAKAAKGMF